MDNETLTQTAQGAIESLRQSTARASGDLAAKSKVAVGAMSSWVGQQLRKSRQNSSARAASPEPAETRHAERDHTPQWQRGAWWKGSGLGIG